MATFVKHSSSQRLLLLALLLLAFSVIPAPISGQGTKEAWMGRKDDDIFNGCHYNQKVHDSDIFCCSKDNQCWSQLTECVRNCPCHSCTPSASGR